jgi:hypothetical protein
MTQKRLNSFGLVVDSSSFLLLSFFYGEQQRKLGVQEVRMITQSGDGGGKIGFYLMKGKH